MRITPSETREIDEREKPVAGYRGVAELEFYGGLVDVSRMLEGRVFCTGESRVEDGRLYLEVTNLSYLEFTKNDYKIKDDGCQWISAEYLILDLQANEPSDWMSDEEINKEQENLVLLRNLLDEKLENQEIAIRPGANSPFRKNYGCVQLTERLSNRPPVVGYDRFDSDNIIGNFCIPGERKAWEMKCFWQYDLQKLEEIADEVVDFCLQQKAEVNKGLAQIAQR